MSNFYVKSHVINISFYLIVLRRIYDMLELQKKIEDSMSKCTDNKFWVQLLEYMYNSINRLSLENVFFLDFINMFESIDDKTNNIYWDMDFSKCFYELIPLQRYQLKILYEFIEYVESNLTDDIMALCEDELFRGKKDIKWLIELDYFYQNLINNFAQVRQLSRYEIINSNLKESFPDQEKYFTDLLHDTDWYNLSKNELLALLQGYDFHYLSDKAYYFVLLACIKLCIDMFREDMISLPEEMYHFLKDKRRALHADIKIKKLVKDFIQLLSHKSYDFLTFSSDNLDKLMKIWATN